MSVLLMLSAILLVCKAQPECVQGDMRLTELVETIITGATDSVRNVTFVEYCHTTGTWRVICSHQNTWTKSAAAVACRQLGYSDKVFETGLGYGSGCYGNRERSSVQVGEQCSGTEGHLSECGMLIGLSTCTCGNHAWVACQPACTNGTLRLVDGTNYRKGRVEMCMDGRWGTVCNNQEGLAGAVCAQLGFPREGAYAITNGPGTLSLPIANCTVQSESSLNCAQITDISCDHTMDLGVLCQQSTSLPGDDKDCPNATVSPEDCSLAENCPTVSLPEDSGPNITEDCACPTVSLAEDCPNVEMNEGSLTVALDAVIGILVVLQVITLTGWIVTCFNRKRFMGSIRQRSPTNVKTGRNDSYHLQQINTQETSNEATLTQANQSTYNHTYYAVADRIDVGYAEIGLKQQAPPTVQPEPAHLTPAGASKKADDFYNVQEHTYAMINKKKKAPKKDKEV